MAWQPTNDFEEQVVAMQPQYNYIYGQLEFEERRKKLFQPKQKVTNFLQPEADNPKQQQQPPTTRAKEIQDKLVLMEKIQRMAGTKKLGEHATLEDWENSDNLEAETIGMFRHFGMQPMTDGNLNEKTTLPVAVQTTGVYMARNGRRQIPILLDLKYFEPKSRTSETNINETRRERGSGSSLSLLNTTTASSDASGSYDTAADDSLISSSLSFKSAKSYNSIDDIAFATRNLKMSQHVKEKNIDADLLQNSHGKHNKNLNDLKNTAAITTTTESTKASNSKKKQRNKRPNQKERGLTCTDLYRMKRT